MSIVTRVLGTDLSTKYETSRMAGLAGTIAGAAGMWGTGIGPMVVTAGALGVVSGAIVPAAQWIVTARNRDSVWGKVSGYGLITVATIFSYGQAHTVSHGFAKRGLLSAPQSAPYVAPTDMVKNVGATAALDTAPLVVAGDVKPLQITANSKAKVFPLSAINGPNNAKTLLMYGAIYDAKGKMVQESLATLISDGTMTVLDPAKNQMYMDYAALLRDNNRVDIIQNDPATNTRMYFFPDQNKVVIADNNTDMPNVVRTPTKADQDAIAKGPGTWKAEPLMSINDALGWGFGNSVHVPVTALSDLYKQLFPNMVVVAENAASLPTAGKPVATAPAVAVGTAKTVIVDVSILKGQAKTLSKNPDGSVNFILVDNANHAYAGTRDAAGKITWSNQAVDADALFLSQPGLRYQYDDKLKLNSTDGNGQWRGIIIETETGAHRFAVENKKTGQVILKPADFSIDGYKIPGGGYGNFATRGQSHSDHIDQFENVGKIADATVVQDKATGKNSISITVGAAAVLLSTSQDAAGNRVEHYVTRSKGEAQLVDSTIVNGQPAASTVVGKASADQALYLQPRLQSNPFTHKDSSQQLVIAYVIGEDGQWTPRLGRVDNSGQIDLRAAEIPADLKQELLQDALLAGFKLVTPPTIAPELLKSLPISQNINSHFHPAWQKLADMQRA